MAVTVKTMILVSEKTIHVQTDVRVDGEIQVAVAIKVSTFLYNGGRYKVALTVQCWAYKVSTCVDHEESRVCTIVHTALCSVLCAVCTIVHTAQSTGCKVSTYGTVLGIQG